MLLTNHLLASWWEKSLQCNKIELGSTVKATLETHFHHKSVLNGEVDQLIVPAARNLTLGIVSSQFTNGKSFRLSDITVNMHLHCTIQLTTMQSLQWVLDSTESNENIAYAHQSDCPTGMTPPQYIEFARIRSGGKLQFVNIIRALHEGILDFTKLHTIDLLLQALLQVGPWDANQV